MALILDIHSHKLRPESLTDIMLPDNDSALTPGYFYSAGIHPKDADKADSDVFDRLDSLIRNPQIKAIGECGLDTLCGVPMFRQMEVFRRQAEMAEAARLPLIIHDVKAHGEIVSLRRGMKARMPWIIHGFRGKPSVAEMLLKGGCFLSFGEKFNPDTLLSVPEQAVFAETDESLLSPDQIIGLISDVKGKDMRPVIEENIRCVFGTG